MKENGPWGGSLMRIILNIRLYRPLMRLAHRYGWHFAPAMKPIEREDIDAPMHWCEWCGLRGRVYLSSRIHEADEAGHVRIDGDYPALKLDGK